MVKRNVVLAGLLVLSVCGMWGIAGAAKKEKSVVCVGVFDSRAVALSCGRSAMFRKELAAKMAAGRPGR